MAQLKPKTKKKLKTSYKKLLLKLFLRWDLLMLIMHFLLGCLKLPQTTASIFFGRKRVCMFRLRVANKMKMKNRFV